MYKANMNPPQVRIYIHILISNLFTVNTCNFVTSANFLHQTATPVTTVAACDNKKGQYYLPHATH